MLALSIRLIVAYLVFGVFLSFLARKGRPAEWDESLLASVLGPPLFTLIAAAVPRSGAGFATWSQAQRVAFELKCGRFPPYFAE